MIGNSKVHTIKIIDFRKDGLVEIICEVRSIKVCCTLKMLCKAYFLSFFLGGLFVQDAKMCRGPTYPRPIPLGTESEARILTLLEGTSLGFIPLQKLLRPSLHE